MAAKSRIRFSDPDALPGAIKAKQPDFIEPALATLAPRPMKWQGWLHEIKYDGYRIQLHIKNGQVRALTRRGSDWSMRTTALVDGGRKLKVKSAIIDGEATVLNAEGRSDFQLLKSDISPAKKGKNLTFIAFDLLYLNGYDLRHVVLKERKRILEHLLRKAPHQLRYSEHLEGDAGKIFAEICRMGLEGIVSKGSETKYHSGRTMAWMKVTCAHTETFVVLGYVLEKRKFDGILLGTINKGKIEYYGKLDRGFDLDDEKELKAKLDKLHVETPPVKAREPGARWARPQLLVDVEFRGVTGDGSLRHPTYKSLREDLASISPQASANEEADN
jgi:bifunctional non-homologous end joining protein LigD